MRPASTHAPLRVARGLVAGTVCGLGAVAAHQVAGGHSASWTAALIWPVSVLLCTYLVSRGRPSGSGPRGSGLRGSGLSVPRALLASATAQLGWHLTMLASTEPAPAGMHGMHGAHGAAHGMQGMGPQDSGDHTMLLTHASVAVVTALLCLGADLALLSLLVERILPAPAPMLIRLPCRRAAPGFTGLALAPPGPVLTQASPRGPPYLLV